MNAAEAERIAREVLGRDLSNPLWPGLTESDWADDSKFLASAVLELLAELAQKNEALAFTHLTLRRPRILLTGISSKAMLGYAIGGALPDPEWEYPCDRDDLARCVEVRRVAPAGLHARMDDVLARYRATLGEHP